MSRVFDEAIERWRRCRAEYGDALEALYAAAERDTNGAMLNERGRRAGVDAFTLFMGNQRRALAYASPELVEWWTKHPRITYERFEEGWADWNPPA